MDKCWLTSPTGSTSSAARPPAITTTRESRDRKNQSRHCCGSKTAFAYCDDIYAGMTDAKAAELIPAFGGAKLTRLGMLDFNVSHTMEHYGNLVTYMRI